MQISEKTIFNDLPQVKDFSFTISGISISDLNLVSFNFYDTGSNYFSFNFKSGFLKTNKILYAYNTSEFINIEGYKKDQKIIYKVNDISFENSINFSVLDKLIINTINTNLLCEIFINSNPINYSISVDPIYSLSGNLTGNISSDINFKIKDYSLKFLNSTPDLLSASGSGLGGKFYSGNNIFVLTDIDSSNFEYYNNFLIYSNTIFGEKVTELSSYRGNYYTNNALSLSRNGANLYSVSSLFDGIWNNKFSYSGKNKNYNLSYFVQNLDYLGNELIVPASVKFEPAYPFDNSIYKSEYITGFILTNSGLYSGNSPTVNFSRYYYVEGISQDLNTLLFSTGCGNTILINYIGNSTGEASGYLTLKNVRLSGFYGAGINLYKGAFSYVSYSNGSGYTGVPIISWGTGGECFSIADVSGESGQFKKINNTYADIQSHSDFLTGYPLTSGISGIDGSITGFIITGLQITNIGSGYNDIFPPLINFNRSTGDLLTNNASGLLLYKKTGLYNFTGEWNISYNFYDSNNNELNSYEGFYSGNFNVPIGESAINLNINLTGLDHTVPISGLLTIKIGENKNYKILQNYIYSDRYFSQETGANSIIKTGI